MKNALKFACLKPEDCERMIRWWSRLAEDRGSRARLRRTERPDDVFLTEPFFQFLREMPPKWSEQKYLTASAMVAAVLAHIKEHRPGQSFASQLASPQEGGGKPKMSEMRFQQLQKSRDPEEFFRRLLRAVRLAGGHADIYSLADSILLWMKEYNFGVDREPQKRLAVRWANDYFNTLTKISTQSDSVP